MLLKSRRQACRMYSSHTRDFHDLVRILVPGIRMRGSELKQELEVAYCIKNERERTEARMRGSELNQGDETIVSNPKSG
jgi:hypothetical protein